MQQSSCNSSTSKNHPDIVTADELLDVFRSMAEPSCPQNGKRSFCSNNKSKTNYNGQDDDYDTSLI